MRSRSLGLWPLLPAMVLILVVATGCIVSTIPLTGPPPVFQFPITITDSQGREITFASPPQRIVSLSPAQTEILFALGLGSQVVATDAFSDYPTEARDLPKVGDAFNVNLEQLAALQPDLVYISFSRFVPDIEKLGIKVLYLKPPETLEGVLENIRLLGHITGRIQEMARLVTQMQERITKVQEGLTSVGQGPRVFYELDPGLYTAGPNTFIGSLFGLLKAQNIAEGAKEPYPQLSAEVVIQRDPEVIILADAAEYGYGKETPESVRKRAGWSGISAVKLGRIYIINPDLVSRPGPRIVQGLEALAQMLYPTLFPAQACQVCGGG